MENRTEDWSGGEGGSGKEGAILPIVLVLTRNDDQGVDNDDGKQQKDGGTI